MNQLPRETGATIGCNGADAKLRPRRTAEIILLFVYYSLITRSGLIHTHSNNKILYATISIPCFTRPHHRLLQIVRSAYCSFFVSCIQKIVVFAHILFKGAHCHHRNRYCYNYRPADLPLAAAER